MPKKYTWASDVLKQRSKSVNNWALILILVGIAIGALRQYISIGYAPIVSVITVAIGMMLMAYTEGIKWADKQIGEKNKS